MAYNKQPPLHTIFDFVFVTPELHRDFDTFRARETSLGEMFIPLVALIEYWNRKRPFPSPTIAKYGKSYLHLDSSEIDELCQWIYNMRKTGLDLGENKMEHVHISVGSNASVLYNDAHILLHNYHRR